MELRDMRNELKMLQDHVVSSTCNTITLPEQFSQSNFSLFRSFIFVCYAK